ncbi:MAG: hypothetical protein ACYSR1_07335 [Planctomycetota bacterium]|jgi:hypothetical protein
MKSLSTFLNRVVSSTLCELVVLFGERVPFPDMDLLSSTRNRVFNLWRTFWLFLGQVLSATQSCREALRKAQAWLLLAEITEMDRDGVNPDKDKEDKVERDKKKHFIQHFGLLPSPIQT